MAYKKEYPVVNSELEKDSIFEYTKRQEDRVGDEFDSVSDDFTELKKFFEKHHDFENIDKKVDGGGSVALANNEHEFKNILKLEVDVAGDIPARTTAYTIWKASNGVIFVTFYDWTTGLPLSGKTITFKIILS